MQQSGADGVVVELADLDTHASNLDFVGEFLETGVEGFERLFVFAKCQFGAGFDQIPILGDKGLVGDGLGGAANGGFVLAMMEFEPASLLVRREPAGKHQAGDDEDGQLKGGRLSFKGGIENG